MTTEQETLAEIQNVILKLTPDQQVVANKIADALRTLLDTYGPIGQIAFALVGAEIATKE